MTPKKFLATLFLVVFSINALAVDNISSFELSGCEEFILHKELRVYKDPSLFIEIIGRMYNEPHLDWQNLANENPVLTTLEGVVYFMKLGAPSEFKSFGAISKLYQLAEPKLKSGQHDGKGLNQQKNGAWKAMVVPIRICGSSYTGSYGFVLLSDFQESLKDDVSSAGLPPSVHPNPVPGKKNN